MFGCPAKIGLASTNIPYDEISKLESEDVENIFKNQNENTEELEFEGEGNLDIIGNNCIFFPFSFFGFLSVINYNNFNLMVNFFFAYLIVIAYFCIFLQLHIKTKIFFILSLFMIFTAYYMTYFDTF